jgi:hypothetical protein
MKNPVYAKIISESILRLNKEFPGLPLGEHIANALQGSDIYNVSDKDLAEAITGYIADNELDDFYSHPEANPDEYNE